MNTRTTTKPTKKGLLGPLAVNVAPVPYRLQPTGPK